MSAGLALFAPEILKLLTTPQYAGASSVVGLIAMSYVMVGLTYIAATGPSIAQKTGPVGTAMVAAAALSIGLNFALVPYLGNEGSAAATLGGQMLTPIYIFYRSQKIYHVPYRFRAGVALVAAPLAVMAIGSQIPALNWLLAIALKLTLLSVLVPLLFALNIISLTRVRETAVTGLRRPARL